MEPEQITTPAYYAIIPSDVRYDKRLIQGAKLLYGEITALTNAKGYCWATNDYFMKLYGTKRITIQRWLKSLEDAGYIQREVQYKPGTKEIERRFITLAQRIPSIKKDIPSYQKRYEGGIKKDITPGIKKDTDNITSFNTTVNTTKNTNAHQGALKDDGEPSLNDRFNALWKLYPKKKGKANALNAYKRAIKAGTTDAEIKQGIENYIQEVQSQHIDPQYVKYGSSWFNQKSWEDDPNSDEDLNNLLDQGGSYDGLKF